jgi:hypothetical protein
MDQKKQKIEDKGLYIYNVLEWRYPNHYSIEGAFYSKDEAERFVKILIKRHVEDSEGRKFEDSWDEWDEDIWTDEEYYISIIKNKVVKKAEDAMHWKTGNLSINEQMIENIKKGELICCCVHDILIWKNDKQKKDVGRCTSPSILYIEYKNYPSYSWVCYDCWMNCHIDTNGHMWKGKYKILFKKENQPKKI